MAALVSSRSTGSMPSPSNQPRDERALDAGAGEVVGLARKTTLRGTTTGITTLSTKRQVVARQDHRAGAARAPGPRRSGARRRVRAAG